MFCVFIFPIKSWILPEFCLSCATSLLILQLLHKSLYQQLVRAALKLKLLRKWCKARLFLRYNKELHLIFFCLFHFSTFSSGQRRTMDICVCSGESWPWSCSPFVAHVLLQPCVRCSHWTQWLSWISTEVSRHPLLNSEALSHTRRTRAPSLPLTGLCASKIHLLNVFHQ